MGVSESGGIMVPPQFRSELLSMKEEKGLIRPHARVIPAGNPPDAELTIPRLNQGDNGALAGVEVTWIEEGAEKPKTTPELGSIKLKPHEVAGVIEVTDKLLRNWDAASSFITSLLRSAMLTAEDMAFINGSGTGKPIGILSALNTGAIRVERSTTATVSLADLAKMLEALPAESTSPVWIAHQTLRSALIQLNDAAGHSIFIQGDVTKGLPTTLLGYPLQFTGRTKRLGTEGDLVLSDLSYYLIKDGSGPYIAASEHVKFRENKTVIKAFWNVDAKPWVETPLTLDDGSTKVSPYVILK